MMAALAARGVLQSDGTLVAARSASPRVLLVDGSLEHGRKILLAGGGRCNVTNAEVGERDFVCDAPKVVRGMLREFGVASVRRFFESRGCPLEGEALGKLFPRSGRGRDVLEALVRSLTEAGIELEAGNEVGEVRADEEGSDEEGAKWRASRQRGEDISARRVIIATGGKSLPSTGSRGFGLELARQLGLVVEPPLPALVPLRLKPAFALADLSGVTTGALLSLVPTGTSVEQVSGTRYRPLARAAGSLLVTHSGLSGPAALDISGACARASFESRNVALLGDFWTLTGSGSPFGKRGGVSKAPGACLAPDDTPCPVNREEFLSDLRALDHHEGTSLGALLGRRLPRRLVLALLTDAGLDPGQRMTSLSSADRFRAYRAVVHAELRFASTEGFARAEVTQGGVALSELVRTTLESKRYPGLHFCGEVVNVTGRLGGFNFQWAWTSGFVAGRGAAR